jgi:hypothetical protein
MSSIPEINKEVRKELGISDRGIVSKKVKSKFNARVAELAEERGITLTVRFTTKRKLCRCLQGMKA